MSFFSYSKDLLVYIKESHVNEILLDPDQLTIPEHIKQKFEEERILEERERAKRKEAKQFVNMEIVTIQTLKSYCQTPNFGLYDFTLTPNAFRIRKDTTICELKSIIGEYFGILKSKQRLWKWTERQNETYRIHRPLTQLDDDICTFKSLLFSLVTFNRYSILSATFTVTHAEWIRTKLNFVSFISNQLM